MKLRRLAGIATLVCGLVIFTIGAHIYHQAPREQQNMVRESLMWFKAPTAMPLVVPVARAPLLCKTLVVKRANHGGVSNLPMQTCLAHGDIDRDITLTLLARALLEQATHPQM